MFYWLFHFHIEISHIKIQKMFNDENCQNEIEIKIMFG